MRILLDTLIDIVGALAAHLQAVVVFICQPTLGERVVEPLEPADLQHLPQPLINDFVHNTHAEQKGIERGEKPESVEVFVLQGAVEAVVEKSVEHAETHFEQKQQQ